MHLSPCASPGCVLQGRRVAVMGPRARPADAAASREGPTAPNLVDNRINKEFLTRISKALTTIRSHKVVWKVPLPHQHRFF